jgi:hypothetical protein
MWELEPSEEYERRAKRYAKKQPRELIAVLANLQTIRDALDEGADPRRLPYGFLHIEPRGVLAIDQKGGGRDLAQTRLYLFLDATAEVIHLLTLGDKRSQPDDIRSCNQYVADLRASERGDHG